MVTRSVENSLPSFLRAVGLALALLAPAPVMAAGGGTAPYLKKPDAWFATAEAKQVAEVILSYQSDLGGWPKNTDTVDAPYSGDRKELHPTFDNGATTGELRFLARCFDATKDERYRAAFQRGLGYILKAQYPTGGWPQFYPPSTQYHRHITFNDDAMVRLLVFLREVAHTDAYKFVPEADRKAADKAFADGIACILKCQIRVNGKPTVWCAQHDEIDYSPRPARAFELASFSGSESVAITELLMSLEHPSPEVIAAVEGAVAWFESAKVTGIRLEKKPDAEGKKGVNLVVVPDPAAPPLWARFYDLKTGKPFFCDRDGVPKATIAEIGYERRNGYSWYGTWPQGMIEKSYPEWRKRNRLK
ncbi:pectate lyase [Luteolibacter sp. LG18]|uniref:pectate lyase n=1 Tax=Luteolibacter sp. LG18 TaxID=2819286 RepID=UPI002B2C11AF|nr:pectate lyase [Luteolibacter sp. LG18]